MKYFVLQIKRVLRILPGAIAVVGILLASLVFAYYGISDLHSNSDKYTRFPIAIVGQTEDTYLELGLKAIETFDSSRYSVEILRMDEPSARKELEKGTISAYVVVPDGFMEAALRGEVLTLEYVSTAGAAGLTSIFKDEITRVIEDIVVACQKGMFGVSDVLSQNGQGSHTAQFVHDITLRYVELVLARSQVYQVQTLGIGDSLGLVEYLFSGLTVFLMLIIGVIFSGLYIKRDYSFERILMCKGMSIWVIVITELLALSLGILVCQIIVSAAFKALPFAQSLYDCTQMWWRMIPVGLFAGTFGYCVFTFATNLLDGVVLHFFGCLSLCFVSGCLYPVFFFPERLQVIASYLPAGLARVCVSGCFSGANTTTECFALLGYCLLFTAASVIVRTGRIKQIGG